VPSPSFLGRFLPLFETRLVEQIWGLPLLDDCTTGDSSVKGLIEAQRKHSTLMIPPGGRPLVSIALHFRRSASVMCYTFLVIGNSEEF